MKPKRARPRSWFALLRRDRHWFAVVASLLLLAAGFQSASAAPVSADFVICTTDGATHSPSDPAGHQDCAHCLANASCSSQGGSFAKLLSSALPAWPSVPEAGSVRIAAETRERNPSKRAERLPAIRAPPAET